MHALGSRSRLKIVNEECSELIKEVEKRDGGRANYEDKNKKLKQEIKVLKAEVR